MEKCCNTVWQEFVAIMKISGNKIIVSCCICFGSGRSKHLETRRFRTKIDPTSTLKSQNPLNCYAKQNISTVPSSLNASTKKCLGNCFVLRWQRPLLFVPNLWKILTKKIFFCKVSGERLAALLKVNTFARI